MNVLSTLLRRIISLDLPSAALCFGNTTCKTPNVDRLVARLMWMHIVCAGMAFVTSIINAAEAEFPPKQFLTQHCEKCHSGLKSMGDFDIASLTNDFADKHNREQWLLVLKELKEGNMPPEDKPRPPVKDVQSVMDWISTRAEHRRIDQP